MRRANGLEAIICRCRTKLNSDAQGLKKGYRKEISFALISRNWVSDSLNICTTWYCMGPHGSIQ